MSENTPKFQGKISRSSELHSEFSFEFTVFNMHGDIARKRQNLHLWASQILLAILITLGMRKRSPSLAQPSQAARIGEASRVNRRGP